MVAKPESKFSLGTIVATPACLELLEKHGVSPSSLLARHASGDWGVVDAEDAKANDLAVEDGSRVLSAYQVGSERVWCISEWDRSATTLLLSREY
jgi:hypothetical protein